MSELKPVYWADNEEQALDELAKLKDKWNKKYPMVIGSWENNWPKLPPILSILPGYEN